MASQIPVSQDDRPSEMSEPVSEVTGPMGMRRPLISLDNDLDQEFESRRQANMQMQDDDMLSITPGQREKDSLGLLIRSLVTVLILRFQGLNTRSPSVSVSIWQINPQKKLRMYFQTYLVKMLD